MTSNGCGQPQRVMTMPTVLTVVAASLLLRRRKRRESVDRRGGHSPGGAVVTEASRAGATVAAPAPENRTPLLIPKKDRGIIGWIWWLREVPLMAISTGLVAHVANPAAACLVFCVGLLRLLLMALERRVADVSINADEGAVNTVHHSAEGGPAGLGASHRPQEAEGTVPHQSTTAIMGLWCKDNQASEPMGEAMDLVRLNPLIRRAVGLVNGLEIRVTPEEFSMSVLCAIPWFKVTEVYPLDGQPRCWKRRDYKRGKHTGRVERHGNGVRLHLSWADPVAGCGIDTYTSPEKDVLHVQAVIHVGDKTASYLHVYRRKQ